MANDMNSAVQMLKGILGDDAEDKIKGVMDSLGMSSSGASVPDNAPIQTQAAEVGTSAALPAPASMPNLDGLKTMLNLKGVMESLNAGNDARSQLLLALKPYMRGTRQRGIDSAVRLINLTKLTGLFQ